MSNRPRDEVGLQYPTRLSARRWCIGNVLGLPGALLSSSRPQRPPDVRAPPATWQVWRSAPVAVGSAARSQDPAPSLLVPYRCGAMHGYQTPFDVAAACTILSPLEPVLKSMPRGQVPQARLCGGPTVRPVRPTDALYRTPRRLGAGLANSLGLGSLGNSLAANSIIAGPLFLVHRRFCKICGIAWVERLCCKAKAFRYAFLALCRDCPASYGQAPTHSLWRVPSTPPLEGPVPYPGLLCV